MIGGALRSCIDNRGLFSNRAENSISRDGGSKQTGPSLESEKLIGDDIRESEGRRCRSSNGFWRLSGWPRCIDRRLKKDLHNDAPETSYAALFMHPPHVRELLSGWCRESPLRAAGGYSRGPSDTKSPSKHGWAQGPMDGNDGDADEKWNHSTAVGRGKRCWGYGMYDLARSL